MIVDALIVTAAKGEDDAVLGITPHLAKPWLLCKDKPRHYPFDLWYNDFPRLDGTPIRVVLARTPDQRGVATAGIASPLIEYYRPYCLAMSGVCAGRPGEVNLGDVVIADTVWAYDHGAVILTQGSPQPYFHSEVVTSRMDPDWRLKAEKFQCVLPNELLAARPQPSTRDGKEGEPWRVHQGGMATGVRLVRDPTYWTTVSDFQNRKLLAIEMEASSIGWLRDTFKVNQFIVVKGVMDHADPSKVDKCRDFASRSAAFVLIEFLRKHLDSDDYRGWLNTRSAEVASVAMVSLPIESSSLNVDDHERKMGERLLYLMLSADKGKLGRTLRTNIPVGPAELVKKSFSNLKAQDKTPIYRILRTLFEEHVGQGSLDAQYVRQNCCYYLGRLRLPSAETFLHDYVLKEECSEFVRRGAYLGLLSGRYKEEALVKYLEELNGDAELRSTNAGYYQCYYGDKLFDEGYAFDNTLDSGLAISAILRNLQGTEDRDPIALPIDLATLRYLILQSSTAILTAHQKESLQAILQAGQGSSDAVKDSLERLENVLSCIQHAKDRDGLTSEFYVEAGKFIKRLPSPELAADNMVLYTEKWYADGRFFEAEELDSALKQHVRNDEKKADDLIRRIRAGAANVGSLLSQRLQNGRKMLDIGCSYGSFVNRWVASGLSDAEGIDISSYAVTLGEKLYGGSRLHRANAMDCDLIRNGKWGVICCCDFLEHCFDIDLFLRRLKQQLQGQELLLLYLPILPDDYGVGQLETYPYSHKEHIYFWTHRGLRDVMEQNGFQFLQTFERKQHKWIVLFENVAQS